MIPQALLSVAAGLLLVAAPREKSVQSDSERLQGTWQLASVEINQKPIPMEDLNSDDKAAGGKLAVSGKGYVFTLGEERLELTFKMDPQKTPKAIDLTIAAGAAKGKTYHGIYKLEDNTYTICRNINPDMRRPVAFEAKPESGLMIVVWQRARP